MKRHQTALCALPLDDLDAANGGMRWNANDRQSTNVLDCRGALCRDSNGINWKATVQHKLGVGHDIKPMPTGDGGPLGTPKVPK